MDKDKRASVWALTINNPTEADEDAIHRARQRGWKVEGQKECGESGTVHQQLMVRTGQQRWSAVKKQFPRAHISEARNVAALEQQVTKEETRVGQLATTGDKQPSQARTFDMFADWIDEDDDGRKGGYHRWTPDRWLQKWESFIHDKICEGFQVEQIAVNPQTLAIVKRQGVALQTRSRRQPDRQTEQQEINVATIHNLDAVCEEEVHSPPPPCDA